MNQDPEKISAIRHYIDFLTSVCKKQLNDHFPGKSVTVHNKLLHEAIAFTDHYPLTVFITKHHLTNEETVLLLIAMIPHIDPDFFDNLIQQYMPEGGYFPEICLIRRKGHRGMLPTGETVLFILAGKNSGKRLEYETLFSNDHLFSRLKILSVEKLLTRESSFSGQLIMSTEYIDLLLPERSPT